MYKLPMLAKNIKKYRWGGCENAEKSQSLIEGL
jgi:hypothetical protein